jgi:HTH-type transcriptional regulator/antitoxin HigA
VAGYAEQRLREVAPALAKLSTAPEKMAALPKALDDAGVRLVFVPDIKGARIDGAALWLDEKSPVVALSLRYDRIDCFWFTLMHELAHIVLRHGRKADIVDNHLVGKEAAKPDTLVTQERQADRLAGDWLIPSKAFRDFVKSTRPYFSRRRIELFASRLRIHPGILVGRLQHEGHIPWSNLRNLQERVRGQIESLGRLDAATSNHSR